MTKLSQRISNKTCPEGLSIEQWQVALRQEQALESDFIVEHLDDKRIWGDYLVSSASGGRYKVAFRGVCSERNYCSCLDFRTNGLGTCKHLEAVNLKLQQEVEGYPWSGRSYNPPYSSVFVSYKGGRSIRMRIGNEYEAEFKALKDSFFDSTGALKADKYQELDLLDELGTQIAPTFRVYEDVYDYAQEELNKRAWQQTFLDSYPQRRIPWYSPQLLEERRPLEEALFQLAYSGKGLVIAPKHKLYIQLALSLLMEIYKTDTALQASYVIVEQEDDSYYWQQSLQNYPTLGNFPIYIMTEQSFIQRVQNTHPSVCFVWVDNARGLRDWKNELSIALKKLSISHLYMRIDSLRDTTPIQLSSTLQHISPYLLGPLYRFIHSYRPNFPLSDDGTNAPKELEYCVFFYRKLISYVQGDNAIQRNLYPSKPTSQEKVSAFLSSLSSILEDDEALNMLKRLLRQQVRND